MSDYAVTITYGQLQVAVSSPQADWTQEQVAQVLASIPEMLDAEYARAGLDVDPEEDDGDDDD